MVADTAPALQLTCDDLLQLQPSLQAYLERFRLLFPRRDQAASFAAYAERLLSGERRKSVELMSCASQRRHEPGAPPEVVCGGQPLGAAP